jgi:hypothetical protein
VPNQQTIQNEVAEQPSTCRVCRATHSVGRHYESGLQEGEEYFFVLVLPDDPTSIVFISKIERIHSLPRPSVVPSRSVEDHSMMASQAMQPPITLGGRPSLPAASIDVGRLTTNRAREEDDGPFGSGRAISSSPESESAAIDANLPPANEPPMARAPAGDNAPIQVIKTATGLFGRTPVICATAFAC